MVPRQALLAGDPGVPVHANVLVTERAADGAAGHADVLSFGHRIGDAEGSLLLFHAWDLILGQPGLRRRRGPFRSEPSCVMGASLPHGERAVHLRRATQRTDS